MCPAGCGIDGIGYANGGQSPGWDPAASYRIALEWGNGVMAFSRDGVTLGTVPGELAVVQDVTAANWESGVFPNVGELNVESPGSVVFLRFLATAGSIDRAMLVLHTQLSSSSAGGSGRACAVADFTWSETTLNWANRPSNGVCVGPARSVSSNSEVEWDVTSLVQGGRATHLAVVSDDPDGAHCFSKESGGASQGPRLRVLERAAVDAGVPPEVDAGAPPVDAGTPVIDAGDADSAIDAGSTVGSPPAGQPDFGGIQGSAVGGCGCQGGGSVSLLLGALLIFSRRRKSD